MKMAQTMEIQNQEAVAGSSQPRADVTRPGGVEHSVLRAHTGPEHNPWDKSTVLTLGTNTIAFAKVNRFLTNNSQMVEEFVDMPAFGC
jgi:hypothetical protein